MSGVVEPGPPEPIRPDASGASYEGRNFIVLGQPRSGKSSFIPQLLAEAMQPAKQTKSGGRNARHR